MKKTSATPAAAPRPRGRPRSFDRDKALEAAMKVFWNKGFEGTSIADLTEAMGINPPSLYAAFGDKEGLFLEAVERYEARQDESCPYCEEPTARASVEKLLRDMATEFTATCHPRGCMMVMATATSAASTRRLQKALAARREAGRGRMKARIERGVKAGELAADTDVAALTDFYMAVITGMSLQARDGASRRSLLAMVDTAMRAWPEAPAPSKRAARPAIAA